MLYQNNNGVMDMDKIFSKLETITSYVGYSTIIFLTIYMTWQFCR